MLEDLEIPWPLPARRVAKVGDLVIKALGLDENQLGIVFEVEYTDNNRPHTYKVYTSDGLIRSWLWVFADVLAEPDS